MNASTLVLATLLVSAPAVAQPLPADQALMKLSMKLRGHGPTLAEKTAFRTAAAGDEQVFLGALSEKVSEYLESEEFAAVIETAHSVWWRIAPGASSKLARFIVTNDRSYDELLVKDYVYFNGVDALRAARQGIQTDGALPNQYEDYQVVPLAAGEARYRSVFSNFDFLNTFPDTATNKNRKRANQIFHSFMCETLSPGTKHAALVKSQEQALDSDDPHGSDPACIGCHYRLDPMARFFDQWRPALFPGLDSYFDPTLPAAGQVVLEGGGGAFPGAGESGLGAVLKERVEWRQCVSRRVWEFVYGAGARVEAAALADVMADFDQSGRRLKAAVRAAVLHPYFWSTAEPVPINFADVSPIMRQCGCHGGQAPHLGPNNYPWSADHVENAATVKRLWHAVNGHASYKKMPPGDRPALPPESIATLRAWIQAGARDMSMTPSLSDAEAEEILND